MWRQDCQDWTLDCYITQKSLSLKHKVLCIRSNVCRFQIKIKSESSSKLENWYKLSNLKSLRTKAVRLCMQARPTAEAIEIYDCRTLGPAVVHLWSA
jgi:hypothetical protein